MKDDFKAGTVSRKDFLRFGGSTGALGMIVGPLGLGVAADADAFNDDRTSWAATAKVDVHNHIVPASYVAALASIGIFGAGGGPFPVWTPDAAVAALDQFGINVGILSLSSPGVFFGDAPFAVNLARTVNMEAAAAVTQYPKRLGFFGCLPMPLVQESIAEAKYAIETLQSDGVVMLSNVNNVYVGDPSYEPLMAYLNSVNARVFIHPNSNPLDTRVGTGAPPFGAEFPFDTTRAVVSLLVRGVTVRYPNIKFILAHAGGAVPYLAGRIAYLINLPGLSTYYPAGAADMTAAMQKFYYDTALSTFEYPMAAVRALVPETNVLFGSDYPFAPTNVVESENTGLSDPAVLRPRERSKVGYRNAVALFPSIASKLRTGRG